MQLHITQVQLYTEKKDGSALVDKKGKPYMRAVIKTNEYSDQFLSGFVYNPLKVGDVIEAEVKEEEWQGNKQLKFHIQSAQKLEQEKIMAAIMHMDRNVMACLAILQSKPWEKKEETIEYPPEMADPEAIDAAFNNEPHF